MATKKEKLRKADRAYKYPKGFFVSKHSSDFYYAIDEMLPMVLFFMISGWSMVMVWVVIEWTTPGRITAAVWALSIILTLIWYYKDFYNGYYFGKDAIYRVRWNKEHLLITYKELNPYLNTATIQLKAKGMLVKCPVFKIFFHYETESATSRTEVKKCYEILYRLSGNHFPTWSEKAFEPCAKDRIYNRRRKQSTVVLFIGVVFLLIGVACNGFSSADFWVLAMASIIQNVSFYVLWKQTVLMEKNQIKKEEKIAPEFLSPFFGIKANYVISGLVTFLALFCNIVIILFLG